MDAGGRGGDETVSGQSQVIVHVSVLQHPATWLTAAEIKKQMDQQSSVKK